MNLLHKFSGVGAAIVMFLTFVADLSYNFGAVADIFPPEVKKWVAMGGAMATLILFSLHSMTSQGQNPSLPGAPNSAKGTTATNAVTTTPETKTP